MGRAEGAKQRSQGEAPRGPCPDHPLDYLLFEETLPEGEYGAGEVIVWDFGEFEVVGPQRDDAAVALRDGVLRFALYGKKLRGHWVIIKTKMGGGKRENWLLQKEQEI